VDSSQLVDGHVIADGNWVALSQKINLKMNNNMLIPAEDEIDDTTLLSTKNSGNDVFH
jgi:hypothetical protein